MTRDKLLLDVGGTFIKCSDGRSVPVDSDGTWEEVVGAFRKAVWEAEELAQNGVRVAMPGPFSYEDGQFLMKHKFASVYGAYFADLVGLPREQCRFVHDVVCMLLGEVTPKSVNTAIIALGTGLGFAMFVDGKVLTNDLGSPAVSIYARPYRDGILEDYVSKRGIQGRYGAPSLSVKGIAQRAFSGDTKAQAVFTETGDIIGDCIGTILKEYGIKALLLGGQISRSWQLFAPQLQVCLGEDVKVSPISDFDNATFNGLKNL